MVIKLDERPRISVGENEFVSVNYTDHLGTLEVLAEPLTVTPESGITVSDEAISTATYEEDAYPDVTVGIGKAVQFMATSAVAGTYTIRITVSTNSSPVRTIIRDIELVVA
jgi:hypothetical protein